MIYSTNFYGFEYSPEFLKEMTVLSINGLADLYISLNKATVKMDRKIFIQKLKSTQFVLVLLQNQNINTTAHQIKRLMEEKSNGEISLGLINSFRNACTHEIAQLTKRLDRLEKFYPAQSTDNQNETSLIFN